MLFPDGSMASFLLWLPEENHRPLGRRNLQHHVSVKDAVILNCAVLWLLVEP